MDKPDKNVCKRLEEFDTGNIVGLMERCDMTDYVEFVKEKRLDGRKLLEVTEGIVKLWRPKVNAKRFIMFIEDLKLNPDKYLSDNKNVVVEMSEKELAVIENQYQTVIKKKSKEEPTVGPSTSHIEELLKRIVPAKSFLYRNQPKKTDKAAPSYLPMNAASPKRSRKLFRLSSYEYPFSDLRLRFSKQDNVVDRGYYPMKRSSIFYVNRLYKKPEARTKYKSMSTADELTDKYCEDHFYEDLCYNVIDSKKKDTDIPLQNPNANQVVMKPCMVKIQELFHSFKLPFFRKSAEIEGDKRVVANENEANAYEATDNISNMYDSVHVHMQPNEISEQKHQAQLPVEDYLEPVQVNKDYHDVYYKPKDDSLLGYIMSIFENRFGLRRETNDTTPSEDSESDTHKDMCTQEGACKWQDDRKGRSMADRPLPVPVENEPYYMNIDRSEAENLLKGQPDGTFVLRPSSQPNHAYTLSVSCTGAVHNVGVQRRPDGRLALGFARRGQRSFASVTSLLRHHRKRRLLLVADGGVIGATTLNESPHYYQIPSSIPVPALKVMTDSVDI